MVEKQFIIKDLSGRSEKSYTFNETHIRRHWNLSETDDTTEQTLEDFLTNSECGDSWQVQNEKIICVN